MSLLIYSLTRLVTLSVVSFMSGVLIDLDHLFDYFKNEGLRFSFADFFDKFYNRKYKKYYLLFHSIELILFLGILVVFSGGNEVVAGIFIGMTQHMFFDQMSNFVKPLGYFFIFRMSRGFEASLLFKTKV